MYEPPVGLVAVGAILVGLASGGALYAWPWSRERRRFVVGSVATVLAFVAWRGVLISVNGGNLDVDNPLFLGLSYEDVGSAVMAFAFSAVAFGLITDRAASAERVVKAAALAGAMAMLVDRFV